MLHFFIQYLLFLSWIISSMGKSLICLSEIFQNFLMYPRTLSKLYKMSKFAFVPCNKLNIKQAMLDIFSFLKEYKMCQRYENLY